MPLFTKPQLEKAALPTISLVQKSASAILREAMKSVDLTSTFDIFLSHRYLDANHILGLKDEIEALGHSVFVDWIEQPPNFDRAQVTRHTAAWLRYMMNQCRCLFYALSGTSSDSKWMPWELGYCDGLHGKVAIVPVLDRQVNSEFYKGQEYLSLYPYITKGANQRGDQLLWINESPQVYVLFRQWLEGQAPTQH